MNNDKPDPTGVSPVMSWMLLLAGLALLAHGVFELIAEGSPFPGTDNVVVGVLGVSLSVWIFRRRRRLRDRM